MGRDMNKEKCILCDREIEPGMQFGGMMKDEGYELAHNPCLDDFKLYQRAQVVLNKTTGKYDPVWPSKLTDEERKKLEKNEYYLYHCEKCDRD